MIFPVHLFDNVSDELNIAQSSLIDILFNLFDLGDLRSRILNQHQSIINIRLIYPSVYIYTDRKQGRLVGRDVIYLRLNETFASDDIRWNIMDDVLLTKTLVFLCCTGVYDLYHEVKVFEIDSLFQDAKSD